jgi:hypothetical protein
MYGATSLYNVHSVGLIKAPHRILPRIYGHCTSKQVTITFLQNHTYYLNAVSLLRCCLCSQSKVCPFLSRYTDSIERDSAVSASVSRSSASGLNSKSSRYLCITSIPQSILKVMEQRQPGTATFRWQKTLSGSRLPSTIHPKFAVLQKYWLIKRSLCT